ncbi:uncharacterized protein [Musca autumnalis]|uniref:uncharacterized protein n=1 Tax=Musca autumnalis TaxID=221902 RepID=UPI003CF16AC3
MASLVIQTALFIGLLSCVFHYIAAGTKAPSAKASRNLFAANLFSVVAPEHLSTNVVYSPASIQTCLTLGFAGADGETAEEMHKVLYLGEGDKRQVVQNYGEFLSELFKTPKANGPILKMANRLYVNENLKIAEEYNKITTEYLDAKAENVDFRNSQEAINKINTWVEEQTEKKIKNLMQPGSVDGRTSAVLVNAIYFKAKWLKPFSDWATRKQGFKINNKQKAEVDMMYQDDEFQYGELPEYEAKVLEMPYENSDLSMMIILPNDVEGLDKLEERLKGVDLNEISSKLRTDDVDVFLPKFHIEFDLDLKEPLQKMGLNSMFSNSANFNYLFSNAGAPQKVADVKHKAFLDVNEGGSEAAAASYTLIRLSSGYDNKKTFKADHPFVFAIRSKTAVYFAALFIAILSCTFHYNAAGTIAPSAMASRNLFAANLFSVVAPEHLSNNVVYSPASIQTCLALAFPGADGETAQEMRKALYLGEGDARQVAQNYGEFLSAAFKTPKANGPILKMANRLYVNENLKIAEEYNKITTEYLDAKAENVDFRNSQEAINKINTWVEEQTEKKIKNIMQPGSVDGGTSAVLVNAIYFKAKWLKPFSDLTTSKQEFKMNNKQQVQVDMMYQDDEFLYGELPEYEAKVLEMPYENSDLSMLIILPNSVEGLAKLEEKLKGVDLNEISSKLRKHDVDVFLPKFRIEFDIDLKEPLKKMGLNSMFSDAANFNHLFSNAAASQKVSDVKHKAFLDVNEAGSEAAAASYMKIVPMSLNMNQKTFKADHPFVFAIRSKTAVYFAGHVTKF